MAKRKPTPSAPPSAEVVGNAFVEQYYKILCQSPETVHRFYKDSSLLGRPDVNGVMTVVTTMQVINEKIMSLNYEDHTMEIKTADAQESHEKGVIVLVTGCLTGKDNARRKFTQTFFLAPQDKGYFVLNDVFRYVEESESSVNGTNENAPAVALIPELGAINAPDQLAAEPAGAIEEEDLENVAEVCDPSDNEGSVLEEETIEGHSIYIRNLPYNATVELLEDEFRKFGPIKPNGIQVRSAKKGSCFGFVEFEALSSMQSALQASPIAIGDHQAVVEKKRTTTRVTGNSCGSRGRSSSRGGFRGNSFRGFGIDGGGRGYGRNKIRTQGEHAGLLRGSLNSYEHHREQEQEQVQEQEKEEESHFKQEQEQELERRRRPGTVSFQYLSFYSFLHCILPCFFPLD